MSESVQHPRPTAAEDAAGAQPAQAPMGWYRDPVDPSQERYWEGTRWTHNVREPAESVVVPAGTPGRPAGRPQGAAAEDDRKRPQAQQPIGLIETVTPDGVPIAGFGRRALARLIDLAVAGVLTLVVGWRFTEQIVRVTLEYARANPGRVGTPPPEVMEQTQHPSTWLGVVFVVVLFAMELLFGGLLGRTPGKYALGIKMVPVGEGRAKRPGWPAAIRRAVVILAAGVVDLVTAGLGTMITCLTMNFSRRRQTLQDMVGRTQVVSSAAPPAEPVAEAPVAGPR